MELEREYKPLLRPIIIFEITSFTLCNEKDSFETLPYMVVKLTLTLTVWKKFV